MHRYHLEVLAEEGGNPPTEYAIESEEELPEHLLQVCGLLLNQGYSQLEVDNLLPTAQAYVSSEEYHVCSDGGKDGKTFGQRTAERLLVWAEKHCPMLLTLRHVTDHIIWLVDDVFNKSLVNGCVKEWEEKLARKYGLEPLDWWKKGTVGQVYDEDHGPETKAQAVLIHDSGPQQSEIEVVILEDIYCCEAGSIFKTARHTFAPEAMEQV